MKISPYIIPGIRKEERKNLEINECVNTVAKFFDVEIDLILSKKRNASIVLIRHLCMYFIRKNTSITLKDIGRYFNTDHKTVIHGCNSIKRYIENNDKIVGDKIIKIETLLNKHVCS